MKEPSDPTRNKAAHQNRRSSHFVQNMRDSIQELNRSMHSIEKMIAQSRKIIMQSKENSLRKTISLSKNKDNSNSTAFSPAHKNQLISKTAAAPPGSPKINFVYQTEPRGNSSSHNSSNFTFSEHPKLKKVNAEQNQVDYQQNLLKFQPENVKKQIELKRSRTKDIAEVSSPLSYPQTLVEQTPKKEATSNIEEPPSTEPYQKIVTHGNEIYKFSPQQTASKEKTSQRSTRGQKETGHKIKLKPTPRHNTTKQNSRQQHSRNETIKIQDDQDEEVERQQGSMIEGDSYSYHQEYQQTNPRIRFKTQCKQEDEDSQAYSKHFKYESPLVKSYRKKPQTKKKMNIRLFEGDLARKEPSIPSYRDPKINNEMLKSTPREQRQTLVKQLQDLETTSASEQQRKAKFILKIKKYGFVEKYLNESEIWAIYQHLTWTSIPELKWPIYIVDEVYKKMKALN